MEQASQIIGLLTLAVPLVAGAAAIVWRMHGRKQLYSLLLLALFPLILMGSVLVLGAIFSPSHDSGFSNLAFAVMLIGIFAVIPWMAACAIGFFIGGILRRRYPPSGSDPVDPRAPAAPALITEMPPRPRPHPFAAWRTALVILIGTLAAIAGLTYMSMKTGIEPPRMPSGVPHIPRFPH